MALVGQDANLPSYSDGELAWTSLPGCSTKKFVYNGNGLQAKEKDRVHPTQKPVALMEWCLSFVPNAVTVLDPYMGSGSTGVVCAKIGKRFIGIERERPYFEIACRRIEEAYRQPDIFVPAPVKTKQESLFSDIAE
jgi:site-specific DNA-methyltransferase (adenine-specific)/modification methylase